MENGSETKINIINARHFIQQAIRNNESDIGTLNRILDLMTACIDVKHNLTKEIFDKLNNK